MLSKQREIKPQLARHETPAANIMPAAAAAAAAKTAQHRLWGRTESDTTEAT